MVKLLVVVGLLSLALLAYGQPVEWQQRYGSAVDQWQLYRNPTPGEPRTPVATYRLAQATPRTPTPRPEWTTTPGTYEQYEAPAPAAVVAGDMLQMRACLTDICSVESNTKIWPSTTPTPAATLSDTATEEPTAIATATDTRTRTASRTPTRTRTRSPTVLRPDAPILGGGDDGTTSQDVRG